VVIDGMPEPAGVYISYTQGQSRTSSIWQQAHALPPVSRRLPWPVGRRKHHPCTAY
jgi:hypothetical protein